MKEYIEREAAIEAASIALVYEAIAGLAKHALEALPAADVREVVRGEWGAVLKGSDLRTCSNCGYAYGLEYYNFCPNCGADMRGNEDD